MSKYIDREALIAEFKRLKLGENSFIERVFADGVYAIIEQFHAADVAPVVHGRWIQVDSTKCRCSHCDIIALIALYPHGDKNFCPNCGAKMDMEVED